MVHIIYDVDSVNYDDFFMDGKGLYFEGIPYQRGYNNSGRGVGSVFKSFLRFLIPVLKSAGNVVKTEGLETGARILNDIAQGVPVKEAVLSETKKGMEKVASKVLEKQRGQGRKRRRTRKRRSLIGRSVSKNTVNKKRRFDSLGFY